MTDRAQQHLPQRHLPQRQWKALVVDDDPSVCEHVKLFLEERAFRVEVITVSREFRKAYRTDTDLILLDLKMPSVDGVELLRFLSDSRCEAVVVIMSGVDQDILSAAENIATDHGLRTLGVLAKPLSRESMTSLIDRFHAMVDTVADATRKSLFRAGSDEIPAMEEMRDAIRNRELELHYQPKMSLGERKISGVEALVRWGHPVKGMIPPDYFIPFAEKYGLIDDLTELVVETAFSFYQVWREKFGALQIFVNISQINLNNPDLPERLSARAMEYGVSPEDITLEVTETGLTINPGHALDVLIRLRLRGFQLSIDDFGTGHSSLARLSKTPFRELKIDRLFVEGCDTDHHSRIIVRNTIQLAKNLGLKVVAEGIETEAELALLEELECDQGQGYLFSRPLAEDAFERWYLAR